MTVILKDDKLIEQILNKIQVSLSDSEFKVRVPRMVCHLCHDKPILADGAEVWRGVGFSLIFLFDSWGLPCGCFFSFSGLLCSGLLFLGGEPGSLWHWDSCCNS